MLGLHLILFLLGLVIDIMLTMGILTILTLPIQAFLWIVDIVLAVLLTGRHNREVALSREVATEARHQEQIAAIAAARDAPNPSAD